MSVVVLLLLYKLFHKHVHVPHACLRPTALVHLLMVTASFPVSCSLEDPGTGRKLSVYTDQPGVQLYTGNFLDGSTVGKGGAPIIKHGGVCLETQAWPNAINIPVSGSVMLADHPVATLANVHTL